MTTRAARRRPDGQIAPGKDEHVNKRTGTVKRHRGRLPGPHRTNTGTKEREPECGTGGDCRGPKGRTREQRNGNRNAERGHDNSAFPFPFPCSRVRFLGTVGDHRSAFPFPFPCSRVRFLGTVGDHRSAFPFPFLCSRVRESSDGSGLPWPWLVWKPVRAIRSSVLVGLALGFLVARPAFAANDPTRAGFTAGAGIGGVAGSQGGLVGVVDARLWYRWIEAGTLLMTRYEPSSSPESASSGAATLGIALRPVRNLALEGLALFGSRQYQHSGANLATLGASASVPFGGVLVGASGWIGGTARLEFGAWLLVDSDLESKTVSYVSTAQLGPPTTSTMVLGGESEVAGYFRVAFSAAF